MHLHRQQGGTIEPGLVRMIHATPDGTGGDRYSPGHTERSVSKQPDEINIHTES